MMGTYSVKSTRRITVTLDLNSSIHAIGDVDTEQRGAEINVRETESTEAVDLESRHESDVVIGTRVISKSNQDLDSRLGVAHFQSDGERAGNGELGAVGRLGYPTAWEVGHGIFIEAPGDGVLEMEVG